MEDRFKFRVWSYAHKKMFNVESLSFEDNGIVSQIDFADDGKTKFDAFSPGYGYPDRKQTTLMQSTGLKDKNGKLIYENDVIEHDGELGIIEYNKQFANLMVKFVNSGHSADLLIAKNDFILGNIYENPELLK